MRKRLLCLCLLLGSCLACLMTARSSGANPAQSLTQEVKKPQALVDSAWLASQLRQPDVRLLEIGRRREYDQGHLPRALFVDWIVDITDASYRHRYNILTRQQMETLLSRLGVHKNTTLVLYDKLESRLATRLFWSLRYYGHGRIKVLDGGAKAWVASGQPLVTEVPTFSRTLYRIERDHPVLKVDRRFIGMHLSQPGFVLVDGRPTAQYTGELPGKVYHTGKEHARRGHLPQAINIPWQENLTKTGKFKSVAELKKLYDRAGVTEKSTVVTYCNEGLHAAHPWFVLTELLGYRQVRLYDDSLAEWANTPDRPLVVETATKR